MESNDLDSEKIFVLNANVILVMGVTGAGKSFFVNSVHGSEKTTEGNLLAPCTTDCIAVPTQIGGTRLILIDTPGFDDPNSTDSQILEKISALLALLNCIKANLKGVVYLHRITDIRFTRTAAKTLKMFKHICGDGALSNVFLATTRWDGIADAEGAKRERQLRDHYWRYVLDKGAKMTRYQGTGDSAKGIIGDLMGRNSVVLDLQRELGSGKVLNETVAGKSVSENLENLKAEHESALQELKDLRETNTSLHSAKKIQRDLEDQMLKLDQALLDEKRLQKPIAKNVRNEILTGVLEAQKLHRGVTQFIADIVGILSRFLMLDSLAKDDISDWLSETVDIS